MANPYQILRIHSDATAEEIDEAYYRMRKLVSYGGGRVKEEIVNLAYEILSDEQRRAKIDEALERRRPVTDSRAPRVTTNIRGDSLRSRLQRFLPFV